MKKIVVLVLLVISCCLFDAKAQYSSTKIIRIEVDGKETKKRFKVFFLSNGKWIESKRAFNSFVIPTDLMTAEHLTLLIAFGKYKLKFPEIPIANFNEDWIVGVDEKPFSEEFVKREEMRMTSIAYYIQFQGGEPERQIVITRKKAR
jgi:hypothetical protein